MAAVQRVRGAKDTYSKQCSLVAEDAQMRSQSKHCPESRSLSG